jgi:hypothetical protein
MADDGRLERQQTSMHAGGHQETLNRALAETRILDWLDEALS